MNKTEVLKDVERWYHDQEDSAPVDAGCIECTAGTVPNRLNTGLCAFHKVFKALRTTEGGDGWKTADEIRDLIRKRCDESSQKDFAARIGFTPSFISDVLNGRREVSAWLAEKVGYRLQTVFIPLPHPPAERGE